MSTRLRSLVEYNKFYLYLTFISVNGCSYNVQTLCINTSGVVIACGSKIMPECGGWHNM